MLKSKIHQAVITQADLHYVGSLTIDEELLEKADILINEKVSVYNINNGSRLDTYAIKGERGKGDICLNGAAARLGHHGDPVIICTYCELDEQEIKTHKPTVLVMNPDNTIKEIL
jgi:aspartate 1-decarboxylase